jgi:hypothetical protein
MRFASAPPFFMKFRWPQAHPNRGNVALDLLKAGDASFVSPLVGNGELQVWPRDFQNDILAVFYQGHPSIPVPVWPADRLEFDIDLEVQTVPTDERPLQSRRQSTFGGENREQSLSGHTLDCLHSF